MHPIIPGLTKGGNPGDLRARSRREGPSLRSGHARSAKRPEAAISIARLCSAYAAPTYSRPRRSKRGETELAGLAGCVYGSLILQNGDWHTVSIKTVTLEVADDGTLTLPRELIQALQLLPHQTVVAEARQDALVVKPSRQECLDQIGRILSSTLAGVAWADIEAARHDRCFSE